MRRSEQRKIALGVVRSIARENHYDMLMMTGDVAHAILDDFARTHPQMWASEWYYTATDNELRLFYRDWSRWRHELQALSGL